jgi:hypothetical protein
MFTKDQILGYLKYSIVAAILYLVSVVIFLYLDNYTQLYILYIGNVMFAVVMVFFVVNFSKKRERNALPKMTIAAGHITAAMGVIISCLAIFVILAIMKPSGYSDVMATSNELAKPTPGLEGNGHALMFILFMDAVFGNIGAGSFVSFLLPNMLKSDQKGETATINPEVNG